MSLGDLFDLRSTIDMLCRNSQEITHRDANEFNVGLLYHIGSQFSRIPLKPFKVIGGAYMVFASRLVSERDSQDSYFLLQARAVVNGLTTIYNTSLPKENQLPMPTEIEKTLFA